MAKNKYEFVKELIQDKRININHRERIMILFSKEFKDENPSFKEITYRLEKLERQLSQDKMNFGISSHQEMLNSKGAIYSEISDIDINDEFIDIQKIIDSNKIESSELRIEQGVVQESVDSNKSKESSLYNIKNQPTIFSNNNSLDIQENLLPIFHEPKKLVLLLKKFSENNSALKYTTHSWDAGRDTNIFKDLSEFLNVSWTKRKSFKICLIIKPGLRSSATILGPRFANAQDPAAPVEQTSIIKLGSIFCS
jgi:hypothetical protein